MAFCVLRLYCLCFFLWIVRVLWREVRAIRCISSDLGRVRVTCDGSVKHTSFNGMIRECRNSACDLYYPFLYRTRCFVFVFSFFQCSFVRVPCSVSRHNPLVSSLCSPRFVSSIGKFLVLFLSLLHLCCVHILQMIRHTPLLSKNSPQAISRSTIPSTLRDLALFCGEPCSTSFPLFLFQLQPLFLFVPVRHLRVSVSLYLPHSLRASTSSQEVLLLHRSTLGLYLPPPLFQSSFSNQVILSSDAQ